MQNYIALIAVISVIFIITITIAIFISISKLNRDSNIFIKTVMIFAVLSMIFSLWCWTYRYIKAVNINNVSKQTATSSELSRDNTTENALFYYYFYRAILGDNA